MIGELNVIVVEGGEIVVDPVETPTRQRRPGPSSRGILVWRGICLCGGEEKWGVKMIERGDNVDVWRTCQ